METDLFTNFDRKLKQNIKELDLYLDMNLGGGGNTENMDVG